MKKLSIIKLKKISGGAELEDIEDVPVVTPGVIS
jgi:hypothetical protein